MRYPLFLFVFVVALVPQAVFALLDGQAMFVTESDAPVFSVETMQHADPIRHHFFD